MTAASASRCALGRGSQSTSGAAKKAIAIETHVAAGLPPLDVDPILVEQLLLNLLKNAIDAMDQATVRRIDLVDTVVVRITMTPARKGPYGCLNVTELVPSGLVPIAQTDRSYEEEDQPSTVRPWSIVGQRVDFCVDPDPKAVPVTLRYVARVVNPGRYRWEPTLVQSAVMPDVGTIIPATTITINGIR